MWTVRVVMTSALVAGASLAYGFQTGPPATRTGAPFIGGVQAEGLCTSCHGGPANQPGATLEILDIPEHYQPDSLYTLRIRMSSTHPPPRRWGFQITAIRQADGQGVGLFDIAGIPGLQIQRGSGNFLSRRYVEHTIDGTFAGNDGPVEWSFRWRAPATDLGRILFFAAGNAANNSSTPDGDFIYTTRDTSDYMPPLDAPSGPLPTIAQLSSGRPNPFRERTTFDFAVVREGMVELSILDLQGRRVRTLFRGHHPAGRGSEEWDGTSDDGWVVKPGVYFARLSGMDGTPPLTQRVVFAR